MIENTDNTTFFQIVHADIIEQRSENSIFQVNRCLALNVEREKIRVGIIDGDGGGFKHGFRMNDGWADTFVLPGKAYGLYTGRLAKRQRGRQTGR